MKKIVPEYRAKLALSTREFDDLAAQEYLYAFPKFRPACTWQGDPGPAIGTEGHATFVTFTSPIFSEGGQFAIVEISFREAGGFGYGPVCVVRQRRDRWHAKCENSWIT